jgi:signal transduction histidine kinase/CheY-like chemotaxis protein
MTTQLRLGLGMFDASSDCQSASFYWPTSWIAMSNTDIQRIFRGIPGLFLVLKPDRDFTIVAASDEYLRATHTDERIFGRPIFEVFPDNPSEPEASGVRNLRASLDRVLARKIADKMPLQRYDLRLPAGKGGGFQERHWMATNAPVLGPGGDVVAVAGTTRDVTERQAADRSLREQTERLAESDRAKDEFLATLSHELRNPLAPLRNAIELLRRTREGDTRFEAVHLMMERQLDHLVRLVDDLLEVSRISRGTFSLRKEQVELAAVVRSATETSEPHIRAGGHALVLELPEESLWLEGDLVRMAQILANLLNNAAKYTDHGGRIRLRAWRDGGMAAISVSDNGVGIAPEVMPRMFEMFSRGDRDSGRSQGGLGIGLALSRRLAQLHGGTLEARSDGPGKGSEFIARLPLCAVPDPAAPSLHADQHLTQMRVLVVDDNPDAGDSLAMILEVLGAEVRVARSGSEAIDMFGGYRPSVVLLDIGMPGMNGYEVARALRTCFPEHATTLVALTGWGQEDDRRRAREAGFDHHLVKPADLDVLQHLLRTIEDGLRVPPAVTA